MQSYYRPQFGGGGVSARGCGGLSLVELLIGITLTSLLIGQVVPTFSTLLERQRTSQTTRMLALSMRLTRHVAMTYQTPALLCPKAEKTRGCGSDWASGRLLFLDGNGNDRLDKDEDILRQWPALAAGSTLKLSVFGRKPYLKANTQGFIANQSGNFLYCPPNRDPRYAGQLIFNATGRIRLATDQNGDGIAETSSGPLKCS